MPAFGCDEILPKREIAALAGHVPSLSGQAGVTEAGRAIFAGNCAACHGENGAG